MAFKDVLLPLSSYPEPTSYEAMERAVHFAAALGARISALTFEIELPKVGNALANKLLDIPGMIASERMKNITNVQTITSAFETMAINRGVPHEKIIESSPTSQLAAIVTEHAMVHDVTIIPIGQGADLQQYIAECVIFGSGRPTIVFPEVSKRSLPISFDVVGVAWDFSRQAARAVADALPILQLAKTVRVVTITGEKALPTRRSGAELEKHLSYHSINVVLEHERASGRPIGQALEEYAAEHEIDLLVMGAYGHSRMRDFVLGGATKTIVASPPLPVLLSH